MNLVEKLDNIWSKVKYLISFVWMSKQIPTQWDSLYNKLLPGDIIVINSNGLTNDIINAYEKVDDEDVEFQHTVLVLDNFGNILDVTFSGIQKVSINKYFQESNRLVVRRILDSNKLSKVSSLIKIANATVGIKYSNKFFLRILMSYIIYSLINEDLAEWISDKLGLYSTNRDSIDSAEQVAACFTLAGINLFGDIDSSIITSDMFFNTEELYNTFDLSGNLN